MTSTNKFNDDTAYRIGMGNWKFFNLPLESIYEAAEKWKRTLGDHEKYWLIWNVDNDWCLIQQKLVSSIGWTPLVGYDPRVGAPPLYKDAVMIDFNESFSLPNMFPHFPLEFAFLFTKKLAFWHSDLLVREEKLKKLGGDFETLRNGEMSATLGSSPGLQLKRLINPDSSRYWELIGCTTHLASESQFNNGCGWWMNFYDHVNFKGAQNKSFYWDHGSGIMYWKRHCGGIVKPIAESYVSEGHFSQIGKKNYKRVSPNSHKRNLSEDIKENFELWQCAKKLNLTKFI